MNANLPKAVSIANVAIRVLKAIIFVIGRKKKSKVVNTLNDVTEVAEAVTGAE